MPRIRKQTSNRQSTNDRRKIQRKVRESKKKAKKAAKTNPQWKSKTPKDPGIPNNFPFKDQILAEVSETRRLEAEEKARRKAEKKALRSGKEVATEGEEIGNKDVEMEDTILTGLQVGNEAIGGVGAKRLMNTKTLSRPAATLIHEESDNEDVPILVNRKLHNLKTVIDEADVVIEVLDARDPLAFRSSELEQLVTAKGDTRLVFVLNKIDLCPREAVRDWLAQLAGEQQTFLFKSSSAFLPAATADQKTKGKGKAKPPTDDAWGADTILDNLGYWAQAQKDSKPLTVSVVGVVNAGKSAFVNSLMKRAAIAVYSPDTASSNPTTTQLPQEVTLNIAGKEIRVIDTPGFSWKLEQEPEDRNAGRIRDVLLRSRGRVDKLKDPMPAASEIIARSNPEDLMLLYKTPAFSKGDTSTFLSGVARSNHLVKKHGDLDIVGASRIILRDWATGSFARYTNAPNTNAKASASEGSQLAPGVQSVIDYLLPRKELRKTAGIVRLTPGIIDNRHLEIEGPWSPVSTESISSDGNDLDEEDEPSFANEDEDDKAGSEEESEEEKASDEAGYEAAPLLPLPSKNKRKHAEEIPPSSKRVTFDMPSKSRVLARKTVAPEDIVTKPNTPKKTSRSLKSKAIAPKLPKRAVGEDEAYDFGKFF